MSTLAEDTRPLWAEARNVWPELPWYQMTPKHGAFHHVAVLGDEVVVRLTTGHRHAERTTAEAANLEALESIGFPWALPRLIGGVEVRDAWSGVAMTPVPGRSLEGLPWSAARDAVGRVLEGLHAAEPHGADGALRRLRPVRDWCGGPAWPEIVARLTAPWGAAQRERARALCAEVAPAEPGVDLVVVHGDLSPFNLHVDGGGVVGVIDLDHACVGDPAIDLAGVVAAYGAEAARQVAPKNVVARALVHRASLPLQVAAAAELAGDPALRDHALARAARRLDPAPRA
ncbi:aminoglycoside phosphotransferase family protein [Actinotalea sp. C106]|uniref:aminoglycoside phosphotransferase family protein n=1 Tax=Actinotalea sp. C106 TaxID=2908644 RepID=UPI002028916D|nr:aminoglycoside phosphotransferase family protein [Actinotalea sp. C106]